MAGHSFVNLSFRTLLDFFTFSCRSVAADFFQFELRQAGWLLDCQSWLALAKQAAAVAARVHHSATIHCNNDFDCFALFCFFFSLLQHSTIWCAGINCCSAVGEKDIGAFEEDFDAMRTSFLFSFNFSLFFLSTSCTSTCPAVDRIPCVAFETKVGSQSDESKFIALQCTSEV